MKAPLANWIYLVVFLAAVSAVLGFGNSSDQTIEDFGLRRFSTQGIPSLNIVVNSSWTEDMLQTVLCTHPVLESLSVRSNPASELFLPECIYNMTLRTLTVDSMLIPNMSILPNTLTGIYITRRTGGALLDWNWSFLERLPLLHSLRLDSDRLESTLPECVNLTLFSATNNNLNGTIPQSLFSCSPNLRQLFLNGNRLTHWPDPTPGNLATVTDINLLNNQLVQIPSPESFESMTSLTFLTLSNNPLHGVTQPIRNATKLISYYIANCSFSGALPELEPNNISCIYNRCARRESIRIIHCQ